MKEYACYGYNEFIICCGYKQHIIKEYFANYYLHNSDITFDFTNQNHMQVHSNVAEPWKVTLVDTGLNTMTGGRIKRIQPYCGDEPFMLTYGDGVSDVDIKALEAFHKSHGKIATITAVNVGQQFGVLKLEKEGTPPCLRNPRWNALSQMVSLWPTGMTVSGNAWTPSGTSNSWKTCWHPGKPRGNCGGDDYEEINHNSGSCI